MWKGEGLARGKSLVLGSNESEECLSEGLRACALGSESGALGLTGLSNDPRAVARRERSGLWIRATFGFGC
jgi:acetate kinase